MKTHQILVIVIVASYVTVLAAQPEPQSDENHRLDVDMTDRPSSLIDLDGIVKTRNKYSIEVDTGKLIYPVKLDSDAVIKLRVISPRIDFEKKQLIIDVEGAEKRYRGYPIPVPLFARIDFVHQKQLQRVMGQAVKRLSDFELLSSRPTLAADEKLKWVGELKPGESSRQLKFQTGPSTTYDVLLAKRGSMSGFKISDLKAGLTAVRISGRLNDDGTVIAKEILFWPTAGYKKTARSD